MKLKEIPENTVVHTPTKEEVNELLAILHENGWDVREPLDFVIREANGISIYPMPHWGWWENINNAKLNGNTILSLNEFKERYVLNEANFAKSEQEKPQPKFCVGDDVMFPEMDRPLQIHAIVDGVAMSWWDDGSIRVMAGLDYLQPYTEPETKPTEDMETKELNRCEKCGANTQQCMDAPCQNYPVKKELNLCELLKGHEGETFYSPFYGAMVLMSIRDGLLCFQNSNIGIDLLTNGQSQYAVDGYCAIFPSKALYEQYPLDPYTAWMKWQEGLPQNRTLKILLRPFDYNKIMSDNTHEFRFCTPADRDKCIEEIKAIIRKYSR